jgi:hypothetical protein
MEKLFSRSSYFKCRMYASVLRLAYCLFHFRPTDGVGKWLWLSRSFCRQDLTRCLVVVLYHAVPTVDCFTVLLLLLLVGDHGTRVEELAHMLDAKHFWGGCRHYQQPYPSPTSVVLNPPPPSPSGGLSASVSCARGRELHHGELWHFCSALNNSGWSNKGGWKRRGM